MKRLILAAFAALSLLVPAHAVRAADKPIVYENGMRQLPAATALQLNAGSTAAASLNLGQGVAPASPVDGDHWQTSAGFFYRAGGITYGPITLSQIICAPPLTGGTITTNGTCSIATNGLALSYLAQIGGSSYLGNQSTSTANVTAYVWPTCSSGQFLTHKPLDTPPIECGTPSTVPSGSNPFAIGSIDIEQIIGAPSSSSLPAGSVAARSDVPSLYQLLTSSASVPAVVQSASSGSNSVTMTATPAAGDMLVGVCGDYPGTPSQASGWTLVVSNPPVILAPSLVVVRKLASSGESTTQTPCTGSTGTIVNEVSGISDWSAQYAGQVLAGNTSGGGSQAVSFTTSSANTLVLGAWVARNGTAGGSVTGLTQAATNAGSGTVGVAGAADQFPTTSSTVNATGTVTGGNGILGALLKIVPGTSSWAQLSFLSTIQNAGSAISTLPQTLNCVAPVSCSATTGANGLDVIAVTSSAPSGSGTTGALAKWSGTSTLAAGDLSGDCTTSASLAVTCLKTNGVAFGTFATQNYATPPAIGGTTPAAGAFTTLSASSTLDVTGTATLHATTLAGVTGSTQCVHVNSSGVVSGTGSDCGSAGGAAIHGTPTAGDCASWFNSTTVQDAGAACGGSGSGTLVSPEGRLTLASNTPVLNSDQTAKSTVYYDCYRGNVVPYYNGTTDVLDTIGSCEVSLTMATTGTGVTNASGVFDVFWSGANHNICVATNGSGGGWASDTGGSNTARGTGYSQVHNTRGYWTNVNAVSHCYNGTTDYGSISADQGTLVGTLYTTAAGQTGMAFKPAAAAGGTNNILGLFNAYNRVTVRAIVRDSSGYNYATATWRAADNSTSNRVSWVDGLQVSSPLAVNMAAVFTGASGAWGAVIGTSLDSTTAAPGINGEASFNSATFIIQGAVANETFSPQIGFHFLQRMEAATSGTAGFDGAGTTPTRQNNSFTVTLEMGLWLEPANDNHAPCLPLGIVLLPAIRRRRPHASAARAA